MALTDEGALVKLIEDFIQYRVDRAASLPKIPEDNPEHDSKFWDSLTQEEREKREAAKTTAAEAEKKEKEEEEKKETDAIASAVQNGGEAAGFSLTY